MAMLRGRRHLKQEVTMVRQFALALATAAAVGGAAFIPSAASADPYGYGVGADVRDIHHDRRDLHRDYRDLHRDAATGRYGAAQRDLADIRRDRHELRHDYRDLRHDEYRHGY
jgi:hypothetical protein